MSRSDIAKRSIKTFDRAGSSYRITVYGSRTTVYGSRLLVLPFPAALSCVMEWFFWALLSALFAGVTAVLAKIGVADVNSNLATAIRTSVILVFSWGIAFFTTKGSAIAAIDRKAWIMLVLSGLATGLSWLCYFRALQVGAVSKVAPIDKLSVVVAIGLGILFLHEKFYLREAIGAVLIIVGALVLALK